MGFILLSDEDNGQGMRWIEIVPTNEAQTSIVLHNKDLISKMQPEWNLGTPSLLFYSKNLAQVHSEFGVKNITVDKIQNMGYRKIFNFADNEGHYFAIMEK